jgi:hypothetical protein
MHVYNEIQILFTSHATLFRYVFKLNTSDANMHRFFIVLSKMTYFMVGIENSGPALRPVGQRAVIVFMRV